MNDYEVAVLNELKEIKFHLSLMTHEIRAKAFGAFEEKIIKTEIRKRIWWAMNDASSSEVLGEQVNASGRTVRDMMQDGEILPFLHLRQDGRAQIPSRNHEAVLDWFLSLHS